MVRRVNAFFDALASRWRAAADRAGIRIAEPALDPVVAEEILQLARVVAHTKERSFAPLASFIAGVAAERLRSAQPSADVAAFIRGVREDLERDLPPSDAR